MVIVVNTSINGEVTRDIRALRITLLFTMLLSRLSIISSATSRRHWVITSLLISAGIGGIIMKSLLASQNRIHGAVICRLLALRTPCREPGTHGRRRWPAVIGHDAYQSASYVVERAGVDERR